MNSGFGLTLCFRDKVIFGVIISIESNYLEVIDLHADLRAERAAFK